MLLDNSREYIRFNLTIMRVTPYISIKAKHPSSLTYPLDLSRFLFQVLQNQPGLKHNKVDVTKLGIFFFLGRTINTYRSALSSVMPRIEGFLVKQHPLVVRLKKEIQNQGRCEQPSFGGVSTENLPDIYLGDR